jgi:hypothetical protein
MYIAFVSILHSLNQFCSCHLNPVQFRISSARFALTPAKQKSFFDSSSLFCSDEEAME